MRGINDPKKQNAISNKIEEPQCAILCLQKIKREAFHGSYVKNLCPRRLSKFLFLHLVGVSGGLLIAWNE